MKRDQKPTTVAIIGAGSRGQIYADYITRNPGLAKVVAVAEPREFHRQKLARIHNVAKKNVIVDWIELAKIDKIADVAIVATQDQKHTGPLLCLADKGYHVLLEKPMAPTANECKQIFNAVEKNNIIFGVCHVLRYTPFTVRLKEIIDSGTIGEIINLQHLEPVGYWHYAHSFVRGNWRNSKQSNFMLLAKSCHDLDWMSFIMGKKCKRVASFGSLKHFRKEVKPKTAASRCLECNHEPFCPYSAKKIYLGFAEKGEQNWPLDVISDDVSVEGIQQALLTGPYGKCVYECDNDAVDTQVVIMDFEGGATATFTMTAFAEMAFRKTRIFGTKGEIYGDGVNIQLYDFLTEKRETIDTSTQISPLLVGHGGGDDGLMFNFLTAVKERNPEKILSGAKESLESHLMVFAAEESRVKGQVVYV
jgi:predicted dehydrogenase